MHWKRDLRLWHYRHNGSFALLSDATETDVAVVFVHGFYGNASSTWQNFERLIVDGRVPAEFSRADFFFYRYPSSREIIEAAVEDFGTFLRWLFPMPSLAFFEMSAGAKEILGLTPAVPRKPPIKYSHLVLVGHSLGGVLVRAAVARAIDWKTLEAVSPLTKEAARSTALALFAPAQFGFRLREELDRVFQMFRPTEALSVLYSTFHARAYKDLSISDGPLTAIHEMTMRLATEDEAARGIRPTTMWARGEIVVTLRDYDVTDFRFGPLREGHTHTSICKPSVSFDDPVRLVRHSLELARQPLSPR